MTSPGATPAGYRCWLAVSTIGGKRAERYPVVTAFGVAAAIVAPILGLIVVYHRLLGPLAVNVMVGLGDSRKAVERSARPVLAELAARGTRLSAR